MVEQRTVTSPYLALDTKLGEGPKWDAATNTLRFVDIERKKLHQLPLSASDPASALRTFDLEDSVSVWAPIAGEEGRFVFGGKAGVGVMDRETGQWRYLARWWGEEEVEEVREKTRLFRANDGAVDARGRFFVGIMNDPLEGEIKNEGILFRFDPDLSLRKIMEPIAIPNGISWTKDDKFIYLTSTTENKITKYPYDIETGDIDLKSGELFWECPFKGGAPDGHTRDAEGCFWVACYGVGKVVRLSEEGELLAEINLPTRGITCPAIAGEDLFITCAAEQDAESHPESAKYQGGLFRVHIGVKGVTQNEFKPSSKIA